MTVLNRIILFAGLIIAAAAGLLLLDRMNKNDKMKEIARHPVNLVDPVKSFSEFHFEFVLPNAQ